LFEEARIAIPVSDFRLDDGLAGASVVAGRLPLPSARLGLLASLIGAERLPIQAIVSIHEARTLTRDVLLARGDEGVGGPLQNLADGRLTDPEHRGDLPLRIPRCIQLPRLGCATLDHGARLMAARATARAAPRPSRARHGRAEVS
jgi:hypothetical protein